MTSAGLRLAPRQRDVDLAELVHLEALADVLDAAEAFEQLPETRSVEPVHLEVDVLRLAPHQPIAHPAADNQRPPAGRTDRRGNRDENDRGPAAPASGHLVIWLLVD